MVSPIGGIAWTDYDGFFFFSGLASRRGGEGRSRNLVWLIDGYGRSNLIWLIYGF
jgi:hypothetical protein